MCLDFLIFKAREQELDTRARGYTLNIDYIDFNRHKLVVWGFEMLPKYGRCFCINIKVMLMDHLYIYMLYPVNLKYSLDEPRAYII